MRYMSLKNQFLCDIHHMSLKIWFLSDMRYMSLKNQFLSDNRHMSLKSVFLSNIHHMSLNLHFLRIKILFVMEKYKKEEVLLKYGILWSNQEVFLKKCNFFIKKDYHNLKNKT